MTTSELGTFVFRPSCVVTLVSGFVEPTEPTPLSLSGSFPVPFSVHKGELPDYDSVSGLLTVDSWSAVPISGDGRGGQPV